MILIFRGDITYCFGSKDSMYDIIFYCRHFLVHRMSQIFKRRKLGELMSGYKDVTLNMGIYVAPWKL